MTAVPLFKATETAKSIGIAGNEGCDLPLHAVCRIYILKVMIDFLINKEVLEIDCKTFKIYIILA